MHEFAHLLAHVVIFFMLFLVLLVSFLAYLAPTFVAFIREHPARWLIAILNVLFGWSLIGWLVCFVWAAAPPPVRTATSTISL